MKKFIIAFTAIASLSASVAHAEVWACQLRQTATNGGVFPPDLVLGFEEGSEDVYVGLGDDSGLYQETGRLGTNNSNRKTVTFRLAHFVNNARQTANLDYRFTLYPGRGRVNATMIPVGYSNQFTTTGTCALQQS